MKKTGQVLLGVISAAFLLTGCVSEVPQLSEQESGLITSYAVASLQKYDKNHKSRLVDTEKIEQERALEAEKKAAQQAKKEKEESLKAEEEQKNSPEEAQPETPVYTNIPEFLQLQGMDIQYAGYEICEKYPKDDMVFAVSATLGKSLVVMKFNVTNQTEQDQMLDMFSQEMKARVAVNGEESIKSMSTMLLNDFIMYQDTIPAGSTQELVIVIEMSTQMTENLTSMILTMRKTDASMELDLLQ